MTHEHGRRLSGLTRSFNHMLLTRLAPRARKHDCIQMMLHAVRKVCSSTTWPYSGNARSAFLRRAFRGCRITPHGIRSQMRDNSIAVFVRSISRCLGLLGLLGPTVKPFPDTPSPDAPRLKHGVDVMSSRSSTGRIRRCQGLAQISETRRKSICARSGTRVLQMPMLI